MKKINVKTYKSCRGLHIIYILLNLTLVVNWVFSNENSLGETYLDELKSIHHSELDGYKVLLRDGDIIVIYKTISISKPRESASYILIVNEQNGILINKTVNKIIKIPVKNSSHTVTTIRKQLAKDDFSKIKHSPRNEDTDNVMGGLSSSLTILSTTTEVTYLRYGIKVQNLENDELIIIAKAITQHLKNNK